MKLPQARPRFGNRNRLCVRIGQPSPYFLHLLIRQVEGTCILLFHLGQNPYGIFLPFRRPCQDTIEHFLDLFLRHGFGIADEGAPENPCSPFALLRARYP